MQSPSIILFTSFLSLFLLLDSTHAQLSLASADFKEGIDNNRFDAYIDVRTLTEWNDGHIDGATLVENLASTGSPDAILGCVNCTLAVYCRSGARAGDAIGRLQTEYNFTGTLYNALGVSQWEDAGYPLVKTDSVEAECQAEDYNCKGCCRDANNNVTTDGDNNNPTLPGNDDITSEDGAAGMLLKSIVSVGSLLVLAGMML